MVWTCQVTIRPVARVSPCMYTQTEGVIRFPALTICLERKQEASQPNSE